MYVDTRDLHPPRLYLRLQRYWRESPDLAEHGRQVAAYAAVIARSLGGIDLRKIYLAGLVHDIGKERIPREILDKPDVLTAEEYTTLCAHSVLGEHHLRQGGYCRDPEILAAVRHHHERYDGDGYPDRLHAEEVPPMAAVLALADTLSSMGSDRCYRARLPWAALVREMDLKWGTQFDPDVVGAALGVLPELEALYYHFAGAPALAA